MHMRQENELLKMELASYEASFVTMKDDKQKLEATYQELQKEKDQLLSQYTEAAIKWEAERQQLEKEKNFSFVEKIQAQNSLKYVRSNLSEAQANMAEACRLSTKNIEKAHASLEE